MDFKDQKKKEFILGVTQRIQDGKWGLPQLEYIQEHRQEYNLDMSDVGLLLTELYRQAYVFAMEDGYINDMERENLLKIKTTINTFNLRKPINRYEINHIKEKILTITKQNLDYNFEPEALKSELRGIRKFPKLRPRPPGAMYDPFDLY